MTQNREAPAYQEYAAAMLSSLQFRLLPLRERGLLYTLRLECWKNQALPASAGELAVVLGIDTAEVTAALPKIMPFFVVSDGWLTCPELEDYRAHLNHRKLRQSEGGKAGAEKTNSGKRKAGKPAPADVSGKSPGKPQGTRRGQGGSLVQHSPVQNSSVQQKIVNSGEVDLSGPAWPDDDATGEDF